MKVFDPWIHFKLEYDRQIDTDDDLFKSDIIDELYKIWNKIFDLLE